MTATKRLMIWSKKKKKNEPQKQNRNDSDFGIGRFELRSKLTKNEHKT